MHLGDNPAYPNRPINMGAGNEWPESYAMGGFTQRQAAAIALLQPNSGLDWLDDMIRARMRDEMAGKTLQGILSRFNSGVYKPDEVAELVRKNIDAMMRQREEKNG